VDPGEEIRKALAEADPGAEISKAIEEAMESGDLAHQALLIPILVIIGTIIFPVLLVPLVVWLVLRHRNQKEQRNHETLRRMIEKGMEIPPNLSFGNVEETVSPLNKGLKYMGLGAGLIVFFLMMEMGGIAGVGAIPLFIGLAYLLIWHLEKKKIQNAG
jgi:purine-cytosine permease-like protein